MVVILALLCALAGFKLLQRYLAFLLARPSVALGQNPRLIVGYMAQLGDMAELGEENHPPALVVKGEETAQVQQLPSGYTFKFDGNKKRKDPVTLDEVWWSDGMLLKSAVAPKDLCFSFALFKLLRCRFAKYNILKAGVTRTSRFFRSTYLQGQDYERVFRVIADELSFVHDYYYSSLSVAFTNSMLLFLNILVSLFTIGYCLYMFMFVRHYTWLDGLRGATGAQIECRVWCPGQEPPANSTASFYEFGIGSMCIDIIPVFSVLSVVVLSEIRDLVVYLCSNWTKVNLICKYTRNDSWKRSPLAQNCIGFVFKYCRSRFVTHWDDKMNQCSVLVLHRRRRLLRLRGRNKKVAVPGAVKAAIFEALRREEGLTTKQAEQLGVGDERNDGDLKHIRPPSFLVSGSITGKGIADTLLSWHIATSLFELKNPEAPSDHNNKIAAIHLSRYCAYLVACHPELLPDDEKWCKSLYKAVKKDADRALSKRAATARSPKADEFQQLVQLLSAVDSNNEHEVLKNGAKLGEQLVDSEITWEALARFWAEMILFVAPSENLEGHAEAIARGDELITLVWALLAHAGIVDRFQVANTITSTGCAAGNHHV